MVTIQKWVIRVLVLIACIGMIIAFTQPWWTGFIENYHFGRGFFNIYGWGIPEQQNVTVQEQVSDHITPTFQVILAWVFLGLCVLVAVGGSWINKRIGALLTGISGAGFLAYA